MTAIQASSELTRMLIRKLEGELVTLRHCPHADPDSASARQRLATIEQLQLEIAGLYRYAEFLARNPPPPRRRRSWRDIPPAGSWKPEL